jgi:predicted Ser/Thr protein kinase
LSEVDNPSEESQEVDADEANGSEDAPREVDIVGLLSDQADRFKERFTAERNLLSFEEYLDVFIEQPDGQVRDTARYIRDCFLYYGTDEVYRPYGAYTRFNLFDCPFDDGRDPLIGHEAVQESVYGHLNDFAVHGRVNRLILLAGPNGSAKSRFISCLMRALEDYSQQDEGALYTFSWIFPTDSMGKGNIGFGSGQALTEMDSFAHLLDSQIDARLINETRDHPLLLLPKPERHAFLTDLLGPDYLLPHAIAEGELSPKAKQIFDALLKAYRGDLKEVLKHIQVERISISRRYRRSAVTIDPQMRVDAGVRQVTADRSLGSLPPSLQNLTLFEPMGDLVDANRGVLEFNDFLKRPVEAFKYILSTCETGAVRLETMTLHLDAVFIGSCNADHLTAFKQMPDFASFKARIELVQVPYLLDHPRESQIYWDLLRTLNSALHIGPHVPDVLGLWAVLCRLEKPLTYREQEKDLQEALTNVTPLEKANMYAYGTLPSEISRETAYQLASSIQGLYLEHSTDEAYEGRFGPSPRILKGLLLQAARESGGVLTGVGILGALRELCEQKAVYQFLQLDSEGEYHNPIRSIGTVRSWYLTTVEDELHQAMGLVDTEATGALLLEYIDHVVHFIRKERRTNPITGNSEPANSALMKDVESRLDVAEKDAETFRESLVHRVAAWRMDNPEDELVYDELFADITANLNEAFYNDKREIADRIKVNLLTYLTVEDARLEEAEKVQADEILTRYEEIFGYPRACAVEVISCLLRARAPQTEESA